jgi:hypothetical protein
MKSLYLLSAAVSAITILTACGPRPAPPKAATAPAATAVADIGSSFKANIASSNIYTHSGVKEVQSIRTTGKDGTLMFGPYATAKAGNYKVVLRGDVRAIPAGQQAVFDVVASKGTTTFFKQNLAVAKGDLLTASFKLDKEVSDFEVRVFVGDKVDMTITGYEVTVQ